MEWTRWRAGIYFGSSSIDESESDTVDNTEKLRPEDDILHHNIVVHCSYEGILKFLRREFCSIYERREACFDGTNLHWHTWAIHYNNTLPRLPTDKSPNILIIF